MSFTTGSVELAHATKLAGQLSAIYSTYGAASANGNVPAVQGFTNSGNFWGLADSYAAHLGFKVTGYTTGAGFPPFGTKAEDGFVYSTDGASAAGAQQGTSLGANRGLTVGIAAVKWTRMERPFAGKTAENFPTSSLFPGRTASIFFGVAGGKVS